MHDVVEERFEVGGRELVVERPRDSEALLDEEAFEQEQFLPYWAELWPSGAALAQSVGGLRLDAAGVVELGCGLALPSIAASLAGADVLATDWSPDALAFAARNAARNGAELDTALVSWSQPRKVLERAPWDLVLAADVLYEHRNVDQLLELLPRLGRDVMLADPARPHAGRFFELARATWQVEELDRTGRVTVYRLRR